MRSLVTVYSGLLVLVTALGCATRSSAPVASIAAPHVAPPPVAEAGSDQWPGADQSPRADVPEEASAEYDSPSAAATKSRETFADDTRLTKRPGLATRWGERRDNEVHEVSFEREHPSRPSDVLALHYDDEDGVAWRTGRDVDDALPGVFAVHGGAIEVSVVSSNDRPLPQLQSRGRTYIVGDTDERYAIRLTNFTRDRYEVVASVDGLDVLTGDEADYGHRGYVLAPWSTLHIEGFRDSADSVRAFRFGDIEESYAISRGYGRDVGVIGVAIFPEELGRDRPYTDGPTPFPGRFAQPPGR